MQSQPAQEGNEKQWYPANYSPRKTNPKDARTRTGMPHELYEQKIEDLWEEETQPLDKAKQPQSTLRKADDENQEPHPRMLPKRDKECRPLVGYSNPRMASGKKYQDVKDQLKPMVC